MVLAELGGQISHTLEKISNVTVLDQKAVAECLNDIAHALHQADVNWDLATKLYINVKKGINPDHFAAGHNKRKIMQQTIFNELCALLGSGSKLPYTPKKGRQCVVMFVGLQGSGKTTTCTKYALYHQKKGWKPSLVCADTYRAGAFDQLKQSATKANVPFFGSYTEIDPVTISKQGVQKFKEENSDLIIVDTSGRHKQEASLFEEMHQVSEVLSPDLIIFVLDGSIGQAAFDQAHAFKKSVPVGAVIVTKMDGGARGGGALSAVAATKSPVIFLGTGEHMDDLEPFEVKPFVNRLLGMGDWSGFLHKVHDVVPMDQQLELVQKISKGSFTLRIMYDQYQTTLRMGPLSQVFSMIPGISSELMRSGREKESQIRLKKSMVIMDSMTNAELDSTNLKFLSDPSRINRIARGSGHTTTDVKELLKEYKQLANAFERLKIARKGDMSARNVNARRGGEILPPQMIKQIGGPEVLQSFIKHMDLKDFGTHFRDKL